jgi:hypothetical protein
MKDRKTGGPWRGFFAPSGGDDLSSHAHRQAIGWLGFFLAPLVCAFSAIFPTPGQLRWLPWDSVSSYYYSFAAVVFVGVLCAMAFYLLTYRGYDHPKRKWDHRLSVAASVFALGVAAFPSTPLEDVPVPAWRLDWMGLAHFGSAIALFICFAIFCLVLFRTKRSAPSVDDGKSKRDKIYLACGILILVGLAWAGWEKMPGHSGHIFFPEFLMLVAFSVSWLTKGRADYTLGRLWTGARSYRGRWGKLPGDIGKALRAK